MSYLGVKLNYCNSKHNSAVPFSFQTLGHSVTGFLEQLRLLLVIRCICDHPPRRLRPRRRCRTFARRPLKWATVPARTPAAF